MGRPTRTAHLLAGSLLAHDAAMFSYDVRPLLKRIHAPTLILHRRDDPIADIAHGRYLSREIPGATLVELPGAEHMYFLGSQGPALEAIRTFIDTHVAGGALRRAVKRVERKSSYGAGWDSLTPSEREVAALIAQGLTNAAIAKRLRISRFTVDGRLRRVFAKLAVSTRVEVSAEYFRSSER
jgi:DNA-binding CsgD family transcriptional regulator